MNNFYSADFVLPVTSEPMPNAIVETDDNGVIQQIWKDASEIAEPQKIKKYKGVIVPGFVNAHCHLELSHMLGKVPRNTGLVSFIKSIISTRKADEAFVNEAMERADNAMYDNGIVAVGDHANTDVSKAVKEKSKIYYHTFAEVLGFEPESANNVLESGQNLKNAFDPLSASVTPHAPYSVSKELMRLISKNKEDQNQPISIHNQECMAENNFYRYKTGDFLGFYEWLGIDIAFFKSHSKSSIQSILPSLASDRKIQLVHNTFTSSKDVSFVQRVNRSVYWCFCPKANMYIEGKLPNFFNFILNEQLITIGTDSLASNDSLCVLSELKEIHQQYPEINLNESIKWATWNGAELLGISDQFGSIEVGKKPGLNLIQHTQGLNLTDKSTVKKLI